MDMQIAPELKQRLEAVARERGLSMDELLRLMVAKLEKESEAERDAVPAVSCYECAEAAGVIGIAEGLPSDLSTNPDHFDGFGRA